MIDDLFKKKKDKISVFIVCNLISYGQLILQAFHESFLQIF